MYTGTKFTKQVYRGYVGTITSNSDYDKVRNGMHLSDHSAGFINHNHGIYIEFGTSDDVNEL